MHVRAVPAVENDHFDFRVYGNTIRYNRKTASRCQGNVANLASKYIENIIYYLTFMLKSIENCDEQFYLMSSYIYNTICNLFEF